MESLDDATIACIYEFLPIDNRLLFPFWGRRFRCLFNAGLGADCRKLWAKINSFMSPMQKLRKACSIGSMLLAKPALYCMSDIMGSSTGGLELACLHGHCNILSLFDQRFINGVSCMQSACEGGHMDMIHLLERVLRVTPRYGFRGACRGGHAEIIECIMRLPLDDYDFSEGFLGACEGGHFDLMQKFLEECKKRNRDPGCIEGFSCALKGQHLEIIKAIFNSNTFEVSAANFVMFPTENIEAIDYLIANVMDEDALLFEIGCCSNLKMLEYLCSKVKLTTNMRKDLSRSLEYNCEFGSPEVVNWLIFQIAPLRKDEVNKCFLAACNSDKLAILDMVVNLGATSWANGLKIACWAGSIVAMKVCYKLSNDRAAKIVGQFFAAACQSGSIKAVNLVISWATGPINWQSGFDAACRCGWLHITTMLMDAHANMYLMKTCDLGNVLTTLKRTSNIAYLIDRLGPCCRAARIPCMANNSVIPGIIAERLTEMDRGEIICSGCGMMAVNHRYS
jgi:hypothetical protein